MNVSQPLQTRTRMFSRVLGPFLVIADVTAIARASDMQKLLSQFEANSLWTWVTGAFVLILGLIIVAGHQYWRGAAAIIVSVLGWLVTLRGLLLLAFPKAFVSVAKPNKESSPCCVIEPNHRDGTSAERRRRIQ